MRFYRHILPIGLILLTISTGSATTNSDANLTFLPVAKTPEGKMVGVMQYNGRFWNQLSTEQKESFVAGMTEGVNAYHATSGVATAKDQEKYIKEKDSYVPQGFLPSETASIIDNIYRDNSNIKIPVSESLKLAVQKTKGLPPNEFEKLLALIRKKFTN